MKLALVKAFLTPEYDHTHSVTFDYLIAGVRTAGIDIEIKVCKRYQEIADYKPDIVGISTASESYGAAVGLAKRIKTELGAIVILGGTHITAVPETLTKDFDCAVIGEGDATFPNLLSKIISGSRDYRMKGVAFHNGDELVVGDRADVIELDDLPITEPPIISYEGGKGIALVTSRGCVNRCLHCSEQAIWRPRRMMSGERLVEIIVHHYKSSGIGNFVFHDDLSVSDLNRLIVLRDGLAKRDLLGKIKIGKVSCNSELVTEDIVLILKELGIDIVGFGLESASPTVLSKVKGGKVKVEDFENAITLFGKHKVRSGASSIWGFPGETPADMQMTKDFLIKWNGTNHFKSFEQYCCQPLPGSLLWMMMLKRGKVSYDMDFSRMRIKPVLRKENWLYINEENVPREQFIKFIEGVLGAIRK
jgi:radical SAM superfamily enzyme YgiQ (UPF0313 family)